MLPQAVQYVLERLEDAGFAAYAVAAACGTRCWAAHREIGT